MGSSGGGHCGNEPCRIRLLGLLVSPMDDRPIMTPQQWDAMRADWLAWFTRYRPSREELEELIEWASRKLVEAAEFEANNREDERRRSATTALRHLRRRFTGTVVDGQIPDAPGPGWVMEVDGKSVWVAEFIDAAIAAAEA